MALGMDWIDGALVLAADGQPLAWFDELTVDLWGERSSLSRGTLLAGETALGARAAEGQGPSPVAVWRLGLTTSSLLQPTRLDLLVSLGADWAYIELVPQAPVAAWGQEELASLRLARVAEGGRLQFVAQRVSGLGHEATGAWWAEPELRAGLDAANPRDWGQMASLALADGRSLALLPLAGDGAVSHLRGESPGLAAVASGGYGRHAYPRVPLLALGLGAGAAAARAAAWTAVRAHQGEAWVGREARGIPEFSEWLGYSAGAALGVGVSESPLDSALGAARQAGIPVRWVLLGEGWQQTDDDDRRLSTFEADRRRHPHGLARAVERLAGSHGLRHIGAWVHLHGAWGGVATKLASGARLVAGADGSQVPHPSEAGLPFYSAWLDALSTAGLDFAWVAGVGGGRAVYLARMALGEAVAGQLASLERAASAAGLALSYGQAVDAAVWGQPGRGAVIRVAPDLPAPGDLATAKMRLWQAAVVGTWLAPVAWPEVGPLPSRHPAARAQAVLAALSGGPVALADPAGRSDVELVSRLVLGDGRLLPPLTPPTIPDRWWYTDPLAGEGPLVLVGRPARLPRVLRIESAEPPPPPPAALYVGLFNLALSGEALTARLTPAELGLEADAEYVANLHFTDERFLVRGDESLEVGLGQLEAELLTLTPVVAERALVGLPHKLLGSSGCHLDDDGWVSLPEPGPALVFDATEAVPAHADGSPYRLVEEPAALEPGTAWRSGPWLMVNAESVLFRLLPAGESAAEPATASPAAPTDDAPDEPPAPELE